ncbi:hypothetical protein OROHE_003023 [Orobanche hederae]
MMNIVKSNSFSKLCAVRSLLAARSPISCRGIATSPPPLLNQPTARAWLHQLATVRGYLQSLEEPSAHVGPIPVEDSIGKEGITRLSANMVTHKVFYTDSNGRDFLKRVWDSREDCPLTVTQPVAGNYYPINTGIFMDDKKLEFSVLVDRATGGSSINDGEIEMMLHRRMIKDDSRGVVEPLDEIVCINNNSTCQGLMVRGKYYVSVDPLGSGARRRRSTGQEIYSPLVLAFSHETRSSSHIVEGSSMASNYSLPLNVALITLQEMGYGSVLLRLANLYEAGEDPDYSTLAKVELKKMFAGKMMTKLRDTSLSANQDKSEMKRMTWQVEGTSHNEPAMSRGAPVDASSLVVELSPMEIRTFVLNF